MGNTCCCGTSNAADALKNPKESLAFFDALPTGVQEATIDHVYDGDTLTIQEQQRARVRFLGVDAPELDENEAYAEESANYVKQLCPPYSKVWLFQSTQGVKDDYDRLLAFVFVSNPTGGPGYLNVNMVLLESGLATFYAPSGTDVPYRDEMLKAQLRGIETRANLWGKVDLQGSVYCTAKGIAFHLLNCHTLKHSQPQNLLKCTKEEALKEGRSPCRECHPLYS